jgi:DNA topoisomerase-1
MNVIAPLVAKRAGLHYRFPEEQRSIHRIRRGKAFSYLTPTGLPIRDEKTLKRIRKLAIPPAYKDVCIAPDPLAHLQAVGRDARGRKQYRYHPKWFEAQGQYKYQHMIEFGQALPTIRRKTSAELAKPGLYREKILAAVVQLLDKTLIRIGNEEYAIQNRSHGLSTLHDRHVRINGDEIVFNFLGKSKVKHEIRVRDRRLAKVVSECRAVPGAWLFQYHDERGVRRRIRSQDVNTYLKQLTGKEFTAKDFRTWGATVHAAEHLSKLPSIETVRHHKQALKEAICQVASKLGNTPTICRKSYIHPSVLNAFSVGLNRLAGPRLSRREREKWVIEFLQKN